MYTRRDCSLCDAAKVAMRASGVDFRIEEIDIDNDPELRRRYSHDVPVVCIGNAEIFRHRIEPSEFARLVSERRAGHNSSLAKEECIPCRGGVPPLKGAELESVAREGAALGYVSSFTTLPRPDSEGSWAKMEAQARRRLHPYFAVKSTMESMVLVAARGGLRATVVNPTACLGPWDRRPRELCVVPMLVTGQVPAMVESDFNVIDVRDVALALRLAMEKKRFGHPIALAGHDCRTDLLARRVCALAGAASPRLRMPTRLAVAGTLWAEAAWAALGRPSPLPAIGPMLLLDGYRMPPSADQLALGVVPRPLDETLRDAIDWYRRIGYC